MTTAYRHKTALLAAIAALAVAGAGACQTPPPGAPPGMGPPPPGMGPPPSLPKTPAGDLHRDAAKLAAGAQWNDAYRYLCGIGPMVPNLVSDPTIEPQKIFDNVSIIGDRGTVMYVIKTSAGVMLIDSGYSSKLDSVLLAGLTKLGVDPASVKYILVTHGHSDHFGGAPYFQSHYGTRVVASDADWTLMATPMKMLPPNPDPWMTAPAPKRDVVVGDGDEIVLGDLHVRAYLIPGHTPGALGFVFPVQDHGQTRMAAIFGGTILVAGRVPDASLHQYVQSLAHFADVTRKDHVEVEFQNHTTFDDTWLKTAALASRKPGDPNPFVVGEAGYQNFLTVMSECIQATIADRQKS